MDTKDLLRKTEIIVFCGKDEKLKDFLSLYFNVSGGYAVCGKSVLVHSDKITKNDLKRGCNTYWSETLVDEETRKALDGCVLIEGISIRDEYTKYFLSSCSA